MTRSATAAAPAPAPRVLILVENDTAPSDRRVWAQSRSLVRAGYDVTIVGPMGTIRDTTPHDTIDGIEIYRYRARPARRAPWGLSLIHI